MVQMKLFKNHSLILFVIAVGILFISAYLTPQSHPVKAENTNLTTLTPIEDAYVDESQPATNYGSLVTSWIHSASPGRRALFRFDLSAIPVGANITSALLVELQQFRR